jgi:hypothetical protein
MRGSPELPTDDLSENRIEKRFPHRFCRDTHLMGVHAGFQRGGRYATFRRWKVIRFLTVSYDLTCSHPSS